MHRPSGGARTGPIRTCVGCRQRHTVDQLLRVGADHFGQLVWDRPIEGRGVWLCRDSAPCAAKALRSKALERGLRRSLSGEAIAAFVAAYLPAQD